jgi:hypothetical protein
LPSPCEAGSAQRRRRAVGRPPPPEGQGGRCGREDEQDTTLTLTSIHAVLHSPASCRSFAPNLPGCTRNILGDSARVNTLFPISDNIRLKFLCCRHQTAQSVNGLPMGFMASCGETAVTCCGNGRFLAALGMTYQLGGNDISAPGYRIHPDPLLPPVQHLNTFALSRSASVIR